MSLDIFDRYATDETLENNGTWRDLGNDARVLVARAGNLAYGKELARLFELHEKDIKADDDKSTEVIKKIMVEVLAKTVLLGWEGITYKRKAMSYSIDNARVLLAHDDFRKEITKLAEDQNAYKAKLEEEQGEA